MNIFDLFYQKKDLIGKLFLAFSILLLIYLFITPINTTYINIDERFTVNLVQLSYNDMMLQMMGDVHPPLYYFFLLPLTKLFNLGNNIFAFKIVSIIPYALMLILASTKIRKEYGWLTAGLYVFSMGTMSDFFMKYLTIRNYSWSMLFLTLSFVFLKDVLSKSDKKSWILFTFFNLCCIYTHNILFISVALMYLVILVHYLIEKDTISLKNELKKWFISGITLFILYLPWLNVLRLQVNEKQGNSLVTFGLYDFFKCFISFAVYNSNKIQYILTIILFVLVVIFAINKYRMEKNIENYHLLSGVGLFVLTLIIGSVILPLLFAPITVRYLLPTYAVFFMAIAILTGKIENKKLFMILLILITVIGCINFITVNNIANNKYKEGIHEQNTLDKINNEKSIVLFNESFLYMCYNYNLENTQIIALKQLPIDYNGKYSVETNLTKILEENPDKDIYFIKTVSKKKDTNLGKNIKVKKGKILGNYHYLKLKPKKSSQ